MDVDAARDGLRGRNGLWRMGGDTDPAFGAAERHGIGSVWYGEVGPDLDKPNQVLSATDRIVVGSGVVNVFATDAREVAASFRRRQTAYPQRFLLGIGVGHPERTDRARRPLSELVRYVDTLFAEGVPAGRVVLAALGRGWLSLAAERTAGALPYLGTPSAPASLARSWGLRPSSSGTACRARTGQAPRRRDRAAGCRVLLGTAQLPAEPSADGCHRRWTQLCVTTRDRGTRRLGNT